LGSQPSSRTEGKPAVRNDRGDRGNVGIIRSPIRASILPDRASCAVSSRPGTACAQDVGPGWRTSKRNDGAYTRRVGACARTGRRVSFGLVPSHVDHGSRQARACDRAPGYSTLILASAITWPHKPVSSAKNFAASAGVPVIGSRESWPSRSAISGRLRPPFRSFARPPTAIP
jgi:hypothetical protein